MKQHLTLQELANEITSRAARKEDFIVDTRDIAISPTGKMVIPGDSAPLAINNHAHSQIAEHAGIPSAYYKRMREEAPELLGTNVRQWFDKYPSRRMIRTLDNTTRAFMSDKYARMDDDAFAEVVLPAIYEVPQAEVVSSGITDTRTTIKMKSARFERQVKQVGDVVQFGVAFSNSEVGSGRLTGSLFAYQLRCTNGMVIEDEMFAATHMGKRNGGTDLGEIFKLDTLAMDSKATILKLRDFTRSILTDGFIDAQVEKMRGLTEVKVADPVRAVERLAKKNALTETQGQSILRHLIEGADLSAWGLQNAVTRAAEDQVDYDEATRLETLGGRMLTLGKTNYAELLAA